MPDWCKQVTASLENALPMSVYMPLRPDEGRRRPHTLTVEKFPLSIKRMRAIVIAFGAVLLSVVATVNAAAESSDERQAVEQVQVIKRTASELWRHGIGLSANARQLERALEQALDVATIASGISGPHWLTATAAERSDFIGALQANIVKSLMSRLGRFDQQAFDIIGVRTLPNRDVVVTSKLTLKDERIYVVDWRFRKIADLLKVIDVATDGRSMTTEKRNEYIRELNAGATLRSLSSALRARSEIRTGKAP